MADDDKQYTIKTLFLDIPDMAYKQYAINTLLCCYYFGISDVADNEKIS